MPQDSPASTPMNTKPSRGNDENENDDFIVGDLSSPLSLPSASSTKRKSKTDGRSSKSSSRRHGSSSGSFTKSPQRSSGKSPLRLSKSPPRRSSTSSSSSGRRRSSAAASTTANNNVSPGRRSSKSPRRSRSPRRKSPTRIKSPQRSSRSPTQKSPASSSHRRSAAAASRKTSPQRSRSPRRRKSPQRSNKSPVRRSSTSSISHRRSSDNNGAGSTSKNTPGRSKSPSRSPVRSAHSRRSSKSSSKNNKTPDDSKKQEKQRLRLAEASDVIRSPPLLSPMSTPTPGFVNVIHHNQTPNTDDGPNNKKRSKKKNNKKGTTKVQLMDADGTRINSTPTTISSSFDDTSPSRGVLFSNPKSRGDGNNNNSNKKKDNNKLMMNAQLWDAQFPGLPPLHVPNGIDDGDDIDIRPTLEAIRVASSRTLLNQMESGRASRQQQHQQGERPGRIMSEHEKPVVMGTTSAEEDQQGSKKRRYIIIALLLLLLLVGAAIAAWRVPLALAAAKQEELNGNTTGENRGVQNVNKTEDTVETTTRPSSSNVPSSSPSLNSILDDQIRCDAIRNGTAVPSQETLPFQEYDVFLDVALDSEATTSSLSLLSMELQNSLQSVIMSSLAGCEDIDGEEGNGIFAAFANAKVVLEDSCQSGYTEDFCYHYWIQLDVYTGRLFGSADFAPVIRQDFLQSSLVSRLDLESPFERIELVDASMRTVTTSPSSTFSPSADDTNQETQPPSALPSAIPSWRPSESPSLTPTPAPSSAPTLMPVVGPTPPPTPSPTGTPTVSPSASPSPPPTPSPTVAPTMDPSTTPSQTPTRSPVAGPSPPPSASPSASPSVSPSSPAPSDVPSQVASDGPSSKPSSSPSVSPTSSPTASPTSKPTSGPTSEPTQCDYCFTGACDTSQNDFSIGCESCDGTGACTSMTQSSSGSFALGEFSCVGNGACQSSVIQSIGDNSCTGDNACNGRQVNIGDESCTDTQACEIFTDYGGGFSPPFWNVAREELLTVESNSCQGNKACFSQEGTVGSGSCVGPNACFGRGKLEIGNDACIGDQACARDFSCGFICLSPPEQMKVANGSCKEAKSCMCMKYVLQENACQQLGDCCQVASPRLKIPGFVTIPGVME